MKKKKKYIMLAQNCNGYIFAFILSAQSHKRLNSFTIVCAFFYTDTVN